MQKNVKKIELNKEERGERRGLAAIVPIKVSKVPNDSKDLNAFNNPLILNSQLPRSSLSELKVLNFQFDQYQSVCPLGDTIQ